MSENQEIQKVNGTWNGTPISIKKVWSGHEFSAEECAKLFNGEIIEFEVTSKKGTTYIAKGKLEEQEFEGHTFIGFKPIFEQRNDEDYFTGTWNGKNVRVKKVWSGHTFTQEEIESLLSGGTITFDAISKKTGNSYKAKGKLEEQTYEGRKFVGFKPDFN